MKNKFINYIYYFCNILDKIPKDKLLHIVVSSVLTSLLYYIIPIIPLFLLMTIIFLGKEYLDYKFNKGCCDWKDVIADYIGFLIGIL